MSTDTAPEAPAGTGTAADDNVRWFADLGLADLEIVGGKNSSLGEMISNLADAGVNVPNGFATTAAAYQRFLGDTGLAASIAEQLSALEDLVRGFLLSKSSATTRTAYATDLASWLHWCNRLDLDPLQAGIHHADAYWCAPSSVESRCCTSCHGD